MWVSSLCSFQRAHHLSKSKLGRSSRVNGILNSLLYFDRGLHDLFVEDSLGIRPASSDVYTLVIICPEINL